MDNLLHKLCEKSEAELWEMVKVEQWTPEHAKVAFYLTEIMKGVKKIEHLKLVQEAMDRAEEMGEEGMEHMLGKEQNMHHYARRGGRMSGGRGSRGRYNYSYFSEDDEDYPSIEIEYARGGNRGGNSGGRGSSNGANYANYAHDNSGGSSGGGNYNMGYHPSHYPMAMPPEMYSIMPYMENKINEKVEKEWEKAEKEWEKKHKDDDKNNSGGRMPPPPPPK